MELAGHALIAWANNMVSDVTQPIMHRHDVVVDEIDPDGWYDAEVMDRLCHAIHRAPNGSQALVAMGKANAAYDIELAEYRDVIDYFERINTVIETILRNFPQGYGLFAQQHGDTHWQVLNNTNLANDFVYGSIWEHMRLLAPRTARFNVRPMHEQGRDDEAPGLFEVKWSGDPVDGLTAQLRTR